jgi:hypothetical protein
LAWAARSAPRSCFLQVTLARTAGAWLYLQPRFFEVEIPLDAVSHLVADASFAPEPEELRALGAQQLLPEALVLQGAFLVAVDLFAALGLLAVASLMRLSPSRIVKIRRGAPRRPAMAVAATGSARRSPPRRMPPPKEGRPAGAPPRRR